MVLTGPPVRQVAVAIELGTLHVETVRDLVADDEANRPEVRSGICLGVEERRLQDPRRDDDLVIGWVVYGVDGLRWEGPSVLVNRGADLVKSLSVPRVEGAEC